MSTWAKDVASRMMTEELERTADSERFAEEQKLRRHLAPRLWMDLKGIVKARCEELNLELGKNVVLFEVQPISEAIVRRLNRAATLSIEFDQEALRIRYQCGADKGEYLFLVNMDTTIEIATISHVPHTADEIAERLLNLLLKSQF